MKLDPKTYGDTKAATDLVNFLETNSHIKTRSIGTFLSKYNERLYKAFKNNDKKFAQYIACLILEDASDNIYASYDSNIVCVGSYIMNILTTRYRRYLKGEMPHDKRGLTS